METPEKNDRSDVSEDKPQGDISTAAKDAFSTSDPVESLAPSELATTPPALTDSDKASIIARLELEQAIRLSIAEKNKSPVARWSWLNSNIGLLLLGAGVTGLLVPAFQYTGKTFDSRRQDRFETLTARIQAMRDSHRDLVGASVAPSQAYELVRPFLSSITLSEADLALFRKGILEINAVRFAQNARVSASLAYFDGSARARAERSVDSYLGLQAAFFSAIERIAVLRYCAEFPQRCSAEKHYGEQSNDGSALLDQTLEAMNDTLKLSHW